MFRPLVTATILAIAGATAAPAAVMRFNDVWANYGAFDDTLGDIAHLDVTNRTRNDFGNASVYEEHIEHWRRNFSDLRHVAYPSAPGKVGELAFAPDAGYSVTIESFDIGTWYKGAPKIGSFFIYDSSWNVLWSLENTLFSGNAITVFPNVTGAAYFQWGKNWDIGIDNFKYSVAQDDNLTAVPLPASLPLLAFGLFGLMALGRRRNKV